MATYGLCRVAVPSSAAQCMLRAGPDELICIKASPGIAPVSHASFASSQDCWSRSRRRKGLGFDIRHRRSGEKEEYDSQRLVLSYRRPRRWSPRQDQRILSSQIRCAGSCSTHRRSLRKQAHRGWTRVAGILNNEANGCTLSHVYSQCSLSSIYQSRRHVVGLSRASGVQNEPHATNVTAVSENTVERHIKDTIENHARDFDFENLLNSKLPSHPKLHRGQLDNGLRYVILPNKVPPNRFEAHLEMHVGSVDEAEHEQGIAHMIEHVAFLGSKKREKLLGTGARSNAYTDFHHTVFHVHSPVTAQGSNEPLLPLVLDALHEIAFKPKFLSSRIEKERRAILSELQMMNTIEYRVDCQLLQQLHSENLLGYRFPIGLEEQIKNWDTDTIKGFHERWYFPANATLFIVGDIGSVGRTIEMIEAQFKSTPPGMHFPAGSHSTAGVTGLAAHLQNSKFQRQVGTVVVDPLPTASFPMPIRKERHVLRPPVKHNWSLPGASGIMKQPHIFQHELLQNFSISLFSKTPVKRVQTFSDLRDVFMRRIVLSTFQFRINTRYKSANPPFNGIELDHSDSGREGCTVTTLTVMCQPKHWVGALKVAIQEAKRLSKYGVTKGELARYSNALLKDSEHLAAMIDNVPSVDNLDFIMESDALGHTVMDQQQGHESLLAVANSVTLEDVHFVAKAMLEYIADFGKPSAPLPTAIIACVPRSLHENGVGDVQFSISPEEIVTTMVDGLNETLVPEPELEVPKELISPSHLAHLRRLRTPAFVPVTDGGMLLKVVNDATGVVLRRLSNGIRINYKITQNEAKGGVMRLVVAGGRARETPETSGAVAVGVRTLSEGGVVGGFSREQVELFCVSKLINCVLEADEEFICMDFHFTLRDGGMRAAFQLLHMVLEHNVWLEEALDRAKQLYLSHYRSMPKSLERLTAHSLMRAMLGGEERFIEPCPATIEKLTLPVVKEAVMAQLVTENMEVSIVGDFSETELDACILDYLGTLTPEKNPQLCKEAELFEKPVIIKPCTHVELRNQKVLLKDTDERACAYIAGSAPNRWGFTADGRDLNTLIEPIPSTLTEDKARALAPPGVEVLTGDGGVLYWKRPRHHLYGSIAMTLLAEIINARLFTTVRDALGLTYDVSFELSLFDRLRAGWFVISVTSTPAKIHLAVEASLNVLKGLHGNRINQRELDRAKRTLMMRHESDSKDNTYWLGLLTHLQAPSVMRKNVSCIRDLPYLYELATADDVYNAYDYLGLENESLYTCIGISGMDAAVESSLAEVEQLNHGAESVGALQGALLHGRGMSTMTRPTT